MANLEVLAVLLLSAGQQDVMAVGTVQQACCEHFGISVVISTKKMFQHGIMEIGNT